MPAQLLFFALSVLRGVFGAGAMRKAVLTFAFDRRTPLSASRCAAKSRSVLERAEGGEDLVALQVELGEEEGRLGLQLEAEAAAQLLRLLV